MKKADTKSSDRCRLFSYNQRALALCGNRVDPEFAAVKDLGKLAPFELLVNASDEASVTAFPSVVPQASDRRTLPACCIFACYDRERASGLAILRPDFYKGENVIHRVREHLHIPAAIDVNYVEASGWGAPSVHGVPDGFECNMDQIDGKVNAYLVRAGYSADKPKEAMQTTSPYPNAGVLLIVVNMLP